jgi:hypothetical protein
MLCVVTEHWYRAERYRLHAEALWKLLDENRAFHNITETQMNGLRAELTDAFRWCWEGRPDDPKADAEGVEEYWKEWGGKDSKVDFDTTAVGIGPHSITVPAVSESVEQPSQNNNTVTQGPSSDDKLHLILDDSGEAGSRTTNLPIGAARKTAPGSTSTQIASGGMQWRKTR